MTTQIDVLQAFKNVIRRYGMSAVYVSHSLAVVAQMADRIVVLSDGVIREAGDTEQILHAPAHPYTQSLIAAVTPNDAERDAQAHRSRPRQRCSRCAARSPVTAAVPRKAGPRR